MNRDLAVSVIKEIFDACTAIEGRSLKLLPPKANNAYSNTCQIHIELRDDDRSIQACVIEIAKKHSLAVSSKNGWLVVFKPYPD